MRRKGVMLCYPLETDRLEGESRKAWNHWPVICQPKLDGIRCKAEIKGGQVLLVTSEENIIYSVPYINDSLSRLPDCTLDGELHSNFLSFEQICSYVLRDTPMPDDRIRFEVFDMVTEQLQHIRLRRLTDLLLSYRFGKPDRLPYVRQVELSLAYSLEDISVLLNDYLEREFEGIIIRHPLNSYVPRRSPYILKFKPKKSDCYKIVGVNQEIDKNGRLKDSLGSFVCFKGDQLFSVGSGLTQEQRQTYWKNPPISKWVRISYQSSTSKGLPRFPVFMEVLDSPDEKEL